MRWSFLASSTVGFLSASLISFETNLRRKERKEARRPYENRFATRFLASTSERVSEHPGCKQAVSANSKARAGW